MLLLALIARLLPFPAEQPDQGALPLNPAVGHLGLTIIALVYVLVVMWRGCAAPPAPSPRPRLGLKLCDAEYLTLQHPTP